MPNATALGYKSRGGSQSLTCRALTRRILSIAPRYTASLCIFVIDRKDNYKRT